MVTVVVLIVVTVMVVVTGGMVIVTGIFHSFQALGVAVTVTGGSVTVTGSHGAIVAPGRARACVAARSRRVAMDLYILMGVTSDLGW